MGFFVVDIFMGFEWYIYIHIITNLMLWDMVISLRKSNIAMEHLERIDDFPNHKTSTYRLIEDFQVPCLIIMITGGYLIELSIYSPIGPSGYGYGNIWEYNGLGGTTPFVI